MSTLIDRLSGLRETGAGRWIALCPAHDDRSPSLSIRELDDGRILIHDFGGCGAGDVLAALGLTLADLYPKPLPDAAAGYRQSRSKIPARDLLAVISEEVSVVATVGATLMSARAISDPDWQRLATAVARIGRARDHAR